MTIEHARLTEAWVSDREFGWGVIAGQLAAAAGPIGNADVGAHQA